MLETTKLKLVGLVLDVSIATLSVSYQIKILECVHGM